MPAAFDKCVKMGGRVRTMKRGARKYQHVCFRDGKSVAGHVKTKQSK